MGEVPLCGTRFSTRKEAWPFYIISSGIRLCWALEEPKGPKGPCTPNAGSSARSHGASGRQSAPPRKLACASLLGWGTPLLSVTREPETQNPKPVSGFETRNPKTEVFGFRVLETPFGFRFSGFGFRLVSGFGFRVLF